MRLPPGELHLVEQHFAELLGAAEIEGAPGEAMDFALHHRHARLEIGGDAAQLVGVHLDAGAFHVQQHGDQAAFELAHTAPARGRSAAAGAACTRGGTRVGTLGGVGGGAVERHLRRRSGGRGRCR